MEKPQDKVYLYIDLRDRPPPKSLGTIDIVIGGPPPSPSPNLERVKAAIEEYLAAHCSPEEGHGHA